MEEISTINLLGSSLHVTRITAMVGLCESEGANDFALGKLWEELLLLRIRAISIDRVHHQGGLNTHGRAVSAVNSVGVGGGREVG